MRLFWQWRISILVSHNIFAIFTIKYCGEGQQKLSKNYAKFVFFYKWVLTAKC
jgi:hypothetical protein